MESPVKTSVEYGNPSISRQIPHFASPPPFLGKIFRPPSSINLDPPPPPFMKEGGWGGSNYALYCYRIQTQNFHPTHLRNETGGRVGGGSSNTLIAVKLGNQYWKYCPLIEKRFMTLLRLKFLLTII